MKRLTARVYAGITPLSAALEEKDSDAVLCAGKRIERKLHLPLLSAEGMGEVSVINEQSTPHPTFGHLPPTGEGTTIELPPLPSGKG